MSDARASFLALDEPWRIALDEAWQSWRSGSAGVGAVISAPDGRIAAVGRNRVLEERTQPGVLASTTLAHGEMNALAVLPVGPTEDLTVTTTFEPCLMCATAIVQTHVASVRYAAADPFFDGMHDWLVEFPFARERMPERSELGGPVGAFAHVLHTSWLAFWAGDGPAVAAHRALRPHHLELAQEIAHGGRLAEVVANDGDVVDALSALWPELVEVSDGDRSTA
jgi:tRNA(Arg) A34 adenosine deaminase TadA